MLGRVAAGLIAGAAMIGIADTAQAGCAGVSASADALANFEKDPAGWLAKESKRPIASDIRAIAVAASANPDLTAPADAHYANFQNALKTVLGGVDSDQAKSIGTALGTFGSSCGKIGGEELAFVAAMQKAVAESGNQNINVAYGEALNEQQTGATGGGGGGGGSGVGGQTGESPTTSFSRTGVTDSNNSVPVTAQIYFTPIGTSNGASSVSTH